MSVPRRCLLNKWQPWEDWRTFQNPQPPSRFSRVIICARILPDGGFSLKTSRSAINYRNFDPTHSLDALLFFEYTKALSSLYIRFCLFPDMTFPNRLHVDTHDQSHLSKVVEIIAI